MSTCKEETPFAIGDIYTVEGSGPTAILTVEPPEELEDLDLDHATGGGYVARWRFENAWPVKVPAVQGGFSDVSGLGVEVHVAEQREGDTIRNR